MPKDIYEAVLERDGDCRAWSMGFAPEVRCNGRLHVHHRRLRSHGGPDTMANLVVLCDHHHHLAHRVRRAEAEECSVILRYTPTG